VYYFMVLPMNSFMARFKKEAPPDKKKCPECLSDIPMAATRCAYCGSSLAASARA
jgi:large conductance mechanosensitive channel